MSSAPDPTTPTPVFQGAEVSVRVSDAHAERMTELFNRYHGKLVKALVVRTRSWEEARDIAAQAFVELLSLNQPATVSFLGAYLYRTARNLATNRLIRGAQHRRKDLVAGYEPVPSSPSPEPLWVELERSEVLHRAIEGLAPHHRMALVLRMWEELSHDEIVARFADSGIKVNERTVRRHLAQALEHCRRKLLASEVPRKQGDT